LEKKQGLLVRDETSLSFSLPRASVRESNLLRRLKKGFASSLIIPEMFFTAHLEGSDVYYVKMRTNHCPYLRT
jgi:hypothetical protein